MVNFLVTNDINDFNSLFITHFSLDKGYFLAKSLAKLQHKIYFLTKNENREDDGIKFVSISNISDDFLATMDYVLISREAIFTSIVKSVPSIKKLLSVRIQDRQSKTKFIIKSDSPIWFQEKEMRRQIHEQFAINMSTGSIRRWVVKHINYICSQNEDFKKLAVYNKIPLTSILVSNMGIPNVDINYSKLVNPYDVKHSYCVDRAILMGPNKALWPLHYSNFPEQRDQFNKKKYIIVYTGRVKVDGGRIFFNMKNIMTKLGNEYELHIFPGSFLIPTETKPLSCSSRNSHSLDTLRTTIFADNQNVIIHYPYEHKDKYRYLHFADCGIDFSDVRPHKVRGLAGHAKILEYCEIGLPVICEDNINNIDLVKRGNNGIILPYMATDDEYVGAIRKMVKEMKVDRLYCRKMTMENENWDTKARELMDQLGTV